MGSKACIGWTLRHTTDESYKYDEVFKGLKLPKKQRITFLAYVAEIGKGSGRRHYHILLVFDSPVPRNSIDRHVLPRLVGDDKDYRGNSLKQAKAWDGQDRFIQYMHKENRPVFIGTMVGLQSHEEYERRCDVWRSEKARIDKQKVKAFGEIFKLCCEAKLNNPERVYTFEQARAYRLRVAEMYLQYYKDNHLRLKNATHRRQDIDNMIFELGNPSILRELCSSM